MYDKTRSGLLIFLFFFSGLKAGLAGLLPKEDLSRESARLDSLQLNTAVEDETNVIGLSKWAGNPAGIILDEEKSRIVPVVKYSNPQKGEFDTTAGLFGVFKTDSQAIQIQSSYQHDIAPPEDRETKQRFTDLTYDKRFNNFFAAANLNYVDDRNSAGETSHSDPLGYGMGIGYTHPLSMGSLDMGLNYKRNDDTLNAWVSGKIPSNQTGVQAIYRRPGVLNVGIAFENTAQDSRLTDVFRAGYNGTLYNIERLKQQIYSERAFFSPSQIPLQFGERIAFTHEENGLSDAQLFNLNAFNTTWGLAHVSKDKNIIGIEYSYFHYNLNDDGISQFINEYKAALGTEYHLMPQLLARASYSYETQNYLEKNIYGKVGVGLGYVFTTSAKLDVSYTNSQTHVPYPDGMHISDGLQVIGTFYF